MIQHIIRVAGLAIIIIVVVNCPCAAQFLLSPMWVQDEAIAGAKHEIQFILSSGYSTDLECTAKFMNMAMDQTGKVSPTEEPTERSCCDWTTVDKEQFTLAAGASKIIICKLIVPRTANGGYSGTLVIETKLPDSVSEAGARIGTTVHMTRQIIAAVLVNVRGIDPARVGVGFREMNWQPKAKIEDDKSPEDNAGIGGLVKGIISNSGNIHLRLTGDVVIRNERGSALYTAQINMGQGYLLAGSTRSFDAVIGISLPDGVYLATASFSLFGTRRQVVSESRPFTILNGFISEGQPSEEQRRTMDAVAVRFLIDPDYVGFDLPRGARRTQIVTLHNLGSTTIEVEPQSVTWNLDENGSLVFNDSTNNPRFRPDVISLTPQHLTLGPGQSQNMTVAITMPRDVDGEVLSGVYLSVVGQDKGTESYLLPHRTILVTALATGTAKPNAEISELKWVPLESKGYQFRITVTNTGNSRCYAKGKLETFFDSKSIETMNFGGNDVVILPGGKHTFNIDWPRVLDPGRYRIQATVEYAEKITVQKAISGTIQ